MTQRPIVQLVCPAAPRSFEELEGNLTAAGLESRRHAAGPGEEEPPDPGNAAILLDVTGLDREAAIQAAASFSRRSALPVVVCGGPLAGDAMLELVSVGVADVVPMEPTPGELRARILAAIERRATQRELRRGYAAFQTLYEQAVSPILIAAPEGRILDANAAARELLGYDLDEIQRLDVAAITHPDDAGTLDLFEALASGERHGYRVCKRFVARDGGVVWADLSASRLVEPDTGEVRLIGEFHNLTPEVETRRDLDRVRERYRLLFETSPLPTLVIDLDAMRFSAANRAAEGTYGYTRQELFAMSPLDVWARAGDAREVAEAMLRSEREIGPTLQRHRRKDGSVIEAEVTSVRIDEGGRPERLALSRDVTAQRRLESDLETARARAAIGRLSGDVGHSMNNLATVLVATARQLLEGASEGDPSRSLVLEMQRVAHELIELTHQLMSIARAADNQPEPLELDAAVEERLDLVRALVGSGVELAWEPAGAALPIRFDPRDLDQLLLNLASNARDAMEGKGRLTLATGRVPVGRELGTTLARLSVTDTGPGLPSDVAQNVFEPYFTTKETGTGLGLTIVKRLASQCGGRVSVESVPGEGTTFHVDFLLDRRRTAEPVATAPQEGGGADVALVDDDEAVCLLVREMLEAAGHRVFTATSGRRALDSIESYPGRYDLLIVDASLPDVPASQIIEHARAARPELKVLIISGYLEDVLIARGVLGRDTPFLSKPFSAEELRDTVRSLLEGPPP